MKRSGIVTSFVGIGHVGSMVLGQSSGGRWTGLASYAKAEWTSNEPPLLLVVSVVPGGAARERGRASPSCTRVAIKRSKVFYLMSELRAARNAPGVPPVAPVRLIGYPLAMA